LLEEHEKYREGFEDVREEYIENGYEKFLIQLSLHDLPYRYETMKLLEQSGPMEINPHVRAFMKQFEEFDTDQDACFLFPESFSSQFFVVTEVCRRAKVFRPIQNLFPNEEKLHYLAVFDKENLDDVLLMFHLLYSGGSQDFFGGYSLYDYSLQWYQTHLQENDTVLRSPYLPDRTAVYQGALPYCWNPVKTVMVRRNIKDIIANGYFVSELEFFENLVRYVMPVFEWWYDDLAMYEEKDGCRTDWKLARTRIRTELTEQGIIKPRWKHELSLFQILRKKYPDTLYQFRPEWLNLQSLDMYIPSLRRGIEYQGIQHYRKVNFFGGEEALLHRWELDRKKMKLCEENGVRVVVWPYDIEPTAANVRRMLEAKKDPQAERVQAFLNLAGFDDYMDQFSRFAGMKTDSAVFAREQELMESDEKYSHREKENIREKKKREILKTLHEEIDDLVRQAKEEGYWILPIRGRKTEYRYHWPNGRRGDIEHYLAGLYCEPEALGNDEYRIRIAAKDYPFIEMLGMSLGTLYTQYDAMKEEPVVQFLLAHHRIAMIEERMYLVNCYKEEYRSLRSIQEPELKKLLQDYHKSIRKKNDEIYEHLIARGKTNPKWKSEQAAYAIVLKYYPDAKFQYQPDFLDLQRLDIFIPSRNTAIEYQGKQHYEPVEFFGGEEGNRRNKERDARKRRRCKAHHIQVIDWDYDKPLTEEYFTETLQPRIEQGGQKSNENYSIEDQQTKEMSDDPIRHADID
ncbi:MAG: hypothetical protein IKD69_10875, partial [Solobacterium sp.]|nr:hypothetical protein [Solobacterium sp.]